MENQKTIGVNSEEEELIRKFREQRVKTLQDQLAAEISRLAEVGTTIKEEKQPKLFTVSPPSDYDKAWYIPAKIDYVFANEQKLKTSRGIYDAIILIEPEKRDKQGDYKFYTDISSTLGTAVKNNRKYKRWRKSESDQWLYGQADWFDAAGLPIPRFL